VADVAPSKKLVGITLLFIIFFDKSKYIKKAQRGATRSTQGVYKGEPKGEKRSGKRNLKN
jgi:hypothetical protein